MDWLLKVDPESVMFPRGVQRLLSKLPHGASTEKTFITYTCTSDHRMAHGCHYGAVEIIEAKHAWDLRDGRSPCGSFADAARGEDEYL
mmetsp:Transcript_54973/g.119915  ORF Transcript_54973/g.119915 Transcript_54973/m.119915 type:complete len:88 (-) Transcript_54973:227-490(-)